MDKKGGRKIDSSFGVRMGKGVSRKNLQRKTFSSMIFNNE